MATNDEQSGGEHSGLGELELEWTLTPTPGRSGPGASTTSNYETFREHLAHLVQDGYGYLVMGRVGSAYPALTLSIGQGLGVVHRFDDADACLLLLGGGQIPTDESRDFLIEGELATFTGEFIVTAAHAADVVASFARGDHVDSLGMWMGSE